jgi:hypothetical protein
LFFYNCPVNTSVSKASYKVIVGGRTSARRKGPTRTIPGNQAMEQQAKRICKTKAIVEYKQVIDKQLLNVEVID